MTGRAREDGREKAGDGPWRLSEARRAFLGGGGLVGVRGGVEGLEGMGREGNGKGLTRG